jgi:hypothetical protein
MRRHCGSPRHDAARNATAVHRIAVGSVIAVTRGLICAAACLPAGFGVAVATGVRPLGGIVLLVLAVLAARWSAGSRTRQALWYAAVLVCFAGSHLLGHAIGAWPAVAVVTVVATATYVVILGLARSGDQALVPPTPRPLEAKPPAGPVRTAGSDP